MIETNRRIKAVIHYQHFPGSLRDVSALYNVSRSSLSRWIKDERHSRPKTKRSRVTKYTHLHTDIVSHVVRSPYMTCADLQRAMLRKHGVSPSPSTTYRILRRANMTYKRAQLTRQASGLKDHAFYSEQTPYKDVIAIDECHFNASDYVRYGWSAKGQRLPRRKNDRPRRLSLLLAVSKAGVVSSRLVKGSVDASVFIDFLSTLSQGSNLILDNASIHKAKVVKEVCSQRGLTLNYIPPYCPWYNPAEYAFSHIKSVFRRERLTSNDFERDVRFAVSNVPCMSRSFCHAESLWTKDAVEVNRPKVESVPCASA